jgi:hypothetical protein
VSAAAGAMSAAGLSVSFSPRRPFTPLPGSGGEAKLQDAHGHGLLLLAQAKLGDIGDADYIEAHIDVSHRVHAGVSNVAHHVSE